MTTIFSASFIMAVSALAVTYIALRPRIGLGFMTMRNDEEVIVITIILVPPKGIMGTLEKKTGSVSLSPLGCRYTDDGQ